MSRVDLDALHEAARLEDVLREFPPMLPDKLDDAAVDALNTENARVELEGGPMRSARRPGRPAGRLFAPVSIAALYDSTSEEIEWLWQDFIPAGTLVLLAAFMKAGKTTLAYALLAALLRGLPFLGRVTRPTRVLLLALEENRRDVKRRLQHFGVSRQASLFVQFRAVPTDAPEWALLAEFVRREAIGLIVVDTLARCWPVWGVDSENDNASVAAALSPLLDLCRDLNVTALLLHHVGKLKTEGHGREVRGAGAILALADQALLFDRYNAGDACERVIHVLGRYDESPNETIIRYDKNQATYSVVGGEDHDALRRGADRLFPAVLSYLRGVTLKGASLRDVRKNVHGRAALTDKAVAALLDRGGVALRDGRFFHPDYLPEGANGERVPPCPGVSRDTGAVPVSAVSPPVRGARTRDTAPRTRSSKRDTDTERQPSDVHR